MTRSYRLYIDWSMLEEQKSFLLALIDADCQSDSGLTQYGPYSSGNHPLDGIVQLLDAIQDQGEAAGERVYSQEESDD